LSDEGTIAVAATQQNLLAIMIVPCGQSRRDDLGEEEKRGQSDECKSF
jgi:hypothetical protein